MPVNVSNSSDEREQLLFRKVFKRIDLDNDGRISKQDLTKLFRRSQLIDEEEIEKRVQLFLDKTDTTNDGGLSYPEFEDFMRSARDHLEKIFGRLDSDKDGFVTMQELYEACTDIKGVDIKAIQKIVNRIDSNNDHTISLSEFCDFYLADQIELYLPSYLADESDFLRSIWRGFHTKWSFCRKRNDRPAGMSLEYRSLLPPAFDKLDHVMIDVGEGTLPVISEGVTESQSGWRWLQQLASGGIAGAVSRTCTAPLDRIKVIMQAKSSSTNKIGVVSGFRYMLEEGGYASLWRGNGINVIKVAPETALKFFFYEQAKDLISSGRADNEELNVLHRFAAGAMAGSLSQTIIYPMEVLKTRMALRKTGDFNGLVDCAAKIMRYEGLPSFYRGFVPNLLGIIPYAGIDLACYETFKRAFVRLRGLEEPSIVIVLACGALSSSCGQIVTYPLALIRTRMQAHGTMSRKSQGSMLHVARQIIQSDGPLGLYRGIVPNFMKVIPAVSISYLVYEKAKTAFGLGSR